MPALRCCFLGGWSSGSPLGEGLSGKDRTVAEGKVLISHKKSLYLLAYSSEDLLINLRILNGKLTIYCVFFLI